jgi:hypothetical protein
MTTRSDDIRVPGIRLQESPRVFVTVIPGNWLLKHTTPSWRVDDPEKGFQRIGKKPRAEEIARTVLDNGAHRGHGTLHGPQSEHAQRY